MSKIINVKDGELEAILKDNELVLVDFWAEWCGPCKAMSPVLEEFSKRADMSKLVIVKVNVDEANALAAKYGIRGIPSFLMFKKGQVSKVKVGSQSITDLLELVK